MFGFLKDSPVLRPLPKIDMTQDEIDKLRRDLQETLNGRRLGPFDVEPTPLQYTIGWGLSLLTVAFMAFVCGYLANRLLR